MTFFAVRQVPGSEQRSCQAPVASRRYSQSVAGDTLRYGQVATRSLTGAFRRLARPSAYDYHIIMESRIRATQAVRSFSDILNRVRYRGETFVIERGGEPVCRLTPVESAPVRFTGKDLVQLLEKLPRPDAGYFDEVERAAKEQPKLRASPWGR